MAHRIPPAVVVFICAALAACDRGERTGSLRASGFVEATEIRVASKMPGRVATVTFAEGARVAAGDVLATVATDDLDLARDRARAERAQAAAQVDVLLAGPRPEDVRHAEAQADAAVAERQAAAVELSAAKLDEARFEQLLQNRAGTEKARDDARARRELAEARLRSASDRVAAATAAVARARAGARAEEIAAARARVAVVDTQLNAIEHDRREATITAPIAGVVTSRLVEPGELIAAGAPIGVLIDLDRAWANAYVEEPLVPGLKLDQPATVITDAGDRLAGRVAAIASRAEFTPRNVQTEDERAKLVYRVKVTVDNRAGILKPGMPVTVEW
jgi:HlyD family secretion protein